MSNGDYTTDNFHQYNLITLPWLGTHIILKNNYHTLRSITILSNNNSFPLHYSSPYSSLFLSQSNEAKGPNSQITPNKSVIFCIFAVCANVYYLSILANADNVEFEDSQQSRTILTNGVPIVIRDHTDDNKSNKDDKDDDENCYENMKSYLDLKRYFECDLDAPRPIISQSTWRHARELYHGVNNHPSKVLSDGFFVPVEAKKTPGKGRVFFCHRRY